MSQSLETFEKEGFRVELCQDPNPESPKDWDQLGTLVTWHRNYCFEEDGRKRFGSPQDFLAEAKREGWIYLNVAMIDHSGISLYEGSGAHACDPGGWDSGQVGFLYTTREKALREFGARPSGEKRIKWPNPKSAVAKKLTERVLEVLRAELQTWDQYVSGDVYYYVVYSPDGDVLDSLSGLYGWDYAKQEAQDALKNALKQEHEAQLSERSTCAL